MSPRPRALTGIKPTGAPHLGNYLGMYRQALALQDTHDAFYFIADYHALTTARDAASLRQESYAIAAIFLALGLDPARAVLFRQSDVPEVLELAWLLGCVTHMGLLERAHAFKAAQDKGEANELPVGTFYYPVLMAADILLYDANVVPVGKDQVQHVEMAQDMAGYFNRAFKTDALRRPEPLVKQEVHTIPGTDGRKMSKSYGNTLELFMPENALRKAIMRITTDSRAPEEAKEPEGDTLYALYKLFATPEEAAAFAERYRNPMAPPDPNDPDEDPAHPGFGYGVAKKKLFRVINREIAPARARYEALMADRAGLEKVLEDGAKRARAVARGVLARVRAKTGLPLIE